MNSSKIADLMYYIEKGEPQKALILLRDEYNKAIERENKIEFTRINNDSNGNPRYVCHYLNFQTKEEYNNATAPFSYELALKRARKIGGGKFHNKQYRGGIVFQSYNIEDVEKAIKELLASIK